MKLMKTLLAALAAGLLSSVVYGADIKISALPGASSMGPLDLTLCDQGGVTHICTGAQVAAMVQANLPNTTGSGNVVFSTAPTLVTPNLGAASASSLSLSGALTTNIVGLTQCVHVNSGGLVTGTGADCGVGSGGGTSAWNALTSGTNTTGTFLIGSGSTLDVTGTGTIRATSLTAIANNSVIGNGAGSSTSPIALSVGCGLVSTPTQLVPSQGIGFITTTSYTVASTDCGRILNFKNAGAIAVSLPAAGSAGFTAGFATDIENKGAGTVTITPASGTVNDGTTLAIPTNTGCTLTSSSANNYEVTACTAVAPGGGGGSSAWNALTSGTNTTGAFLIGAGASLGVTSTGTIAATSIAALTGIPSIATQTLLCNGTGSSSSPTACPLLGGLVATSGGIGFSQSINAQTGTSYTILASDYGKILTFSNASAIAITLPQAGTTGFTSGFAFDVQNKGAGTATITPATSTINGSTTLAITQNRSCTVTSDGTNYQISACTALISTSGTGTVTSVAETVPTGFTISGSPVTTSGTLAIGFSGLVVGGTKFTVAATGCTPSATAGGATAGSITLATGPCTSLVITLNGATGLTAGTGWHCSVNDETATNAGTYIPQWGQKSSTTTTATIPIPAAVGATDKITFSCTGF